MTKEAAVRKAKSGHTDKAASRNGNYGVETVEALLPAAGSSERAALGIAAAVGGALLAAAVLGVGSAALAGAAGYLVYYETRRE
jgi:hypothetical protein